MPEQVRSVYIYELHGHDRNGPLDYLNVFSRLSAIGQANRRYVLPNDGRVVAIPEIRTMSENRYALRFIIGREGDPALFYDIETGAERVARARRNEMAALTAWLVVDAEQRLVVQERRRPGVPLATAVDTLIAVIGRQGLAQNPTLSMHPRVGEGFLEELDELETIKSATIVLQQPNMSWTDSANSAIASMSADSNMGQVAITGSARPKESLDKHEGFIGELRTMVAQAWGPIRSAKAVGRKAGDDKDSTVTTKNYAQRRDYVVPDQATRGDETVIVLEAADTYLNEQVSNGD